MKLPSRKVWIIVALALAVPGACLVDIWARPDVYNESSWGACSLHRRCT